MTKPLYLLYSLALLMLIACSTQPSDVKQTDEVVPMYPDYTDVTIPCNIAPLNFLLRSEAERICIKVNDEELYNGSGNEVQIDEDEWANLLDENTGKKVNVQVFAKENGEWKAYKSFTWDIVPDKVDPYLTYRLIEPDYEVYNNLQIQERCVENFNVRNISDYKHTPGRCMNCHTYSQQNPDLSMLYVRGEGGGAFLNQKGHIAKLNLNTPELISGSVYFGFHPSGRYITFSSNVILPTFHSKAEKRMEVVDRVSDVYVADLQEGTIIASPLLSDTTRFETFPTFSPDGKYIYYCTSPSIDHTSRLRELQYSLCRIPFNDGKIGEKVDTIYNAGKKHHSTCHPRISPDGRWLIFTIADYGTFPIWHKESDLAIIDLTRLGDDEHFEALNKAMQKVNSTQSDTYHSWSSNSRWLVFASKHDDGLYGKPYYTYIDKNGKAHKPFVLPQKHPSFYDNCLKSFNAPEIGKGKLPFEAEDIAEAMEQVPVNFTLYNK